jgi:hypothetical protein
VPGLRREEVARLAGVSLDYYTQLERGNIRGASESVLNAIARALQLDDVEREHLSTWLVRSPGRRPRGAAEGRRRPVRPSVQRVLDAMTVPAVVVNAQQNLVAANLMVGRCSRRTSRPTGPPWPGSSSSTPAPAIPTSTGRWPGA